MVRLPPALAALVEGATREPVTLGESGAQVYRLRSDAETRYIKVEPRRPHSELHAEAERLRWLQGRLPVPALRSPAPTSARATCSPSRCQVPTPVTSSSTSAFREMRYTP